MLWKIFQKKPKGPKNPVSNKSDTPDSSVFSKLPLELLDLIFSFLSTPELAVVVRTSGLLKRYGERVLYANIQLKNRITQYTLNGLIHTINQRPELGLGTQTVVFEGGCKEGRAERYYRNDPGRWFELCVPDALKKLKLKGKKKWRLEEMDPMECFGLLLPLVPNVQRLRVALGVFTSDAFEAFARLRPCGVCDGGVCRLSLPLHRLETVEMVLYRWYTGCERIKQAAEAAAGRTANLPLLREWVGVLPDIPHDYDGRYKLESLTCCVMEGDRLKEFLGRCPGLKRFEYVHISDGIYCDELYEALSPLVETKIQELVITDGGTGYYYNMLYGEGNEYDFHKVSRYFGTLRGFEWLEKVEMSWLCLTVRNTEDTTGDILPPGLRKLTINDYLGFMGRTEDNHKNGNRDSNRHGDRQAIERSVGRQKAMFAAYMVDWRVYTPRLEGITVIRDVGWTIIDERRHLGFLEAACEAADVGLEVAPFSQRSWL